MQMDLQALSKGFTGFVRKDSHLSNCTNCTIYAKRIPSCLKKDVQVSRKNVDIFRSWQVSSKTEAQVSGKRFCLLQKGLQRSVHSLARILIRSAARISSLIRSGADIPISICAGARIRIFALQFAASMRQYRDIWRGRDADDLGDVEAGTL
jgi:hypothetical protein